MDRSDFLYKEFLGRFSYELTPCQDSLLHGIASFLTGDDADIMVVNGYAGTGKTTALSAVVDVASVTRYYLLQSSTLSPPAKPTTKPPTGSWTAFSGK